MADPKDMYRCPVSNCGYVYDPDRGDKRRKIPAGTRFEDLPGRLDLSRLRGIQEELQASERGLTHEAGGKVAPSPPASSLSSKEAYFH